MDLAAKFRETALSVLPVTAIVLVLGCTAAPLGAAALGRFAAGSLLLVAGLTVFLLGVDLGIQPLGDRTGAALVARRSLALLLGAAFFVGLAVTAAEPDVQVFADQVRGAFPGAGKGTLTLSIAAGVGLFMALGLLRSVLGFPLKAVLAVCYAGLFALALAAPAAASGVAFDAGGATTGPMTVPFVMALGLGVAGSRARGGAEGGFGLTGVASVGPVAAVLVCALLDTQAFTHAEGTVSRAEVVVSRAEGAEGFVSHAENAENAEGFVSHAENAENAEVFVSHAEGVDAREGFWGPFAEAAGPALRESAVSILPLFAMFLAFRKRLLRMSGRQAARLAIGFVYALAGLFVFFVGVNGGFMQAGAALGTALGAKAAAGGAGAWALLVGTGLALGAIVVCAEPAVWVLSEQVEKITDGAIRRRTLLAFLSAATAAAVGLAMWRAVAGFPLWTALVPVYGASMLLMAASPPLFTAVAFDSGGVASGPLTTTFVLSFALGAASGGGGGADPFGVVALVAAMPLLALQVLGVLYERGRRRALRAAPAPAPETGENA